MFAETIGNPCLDVTDIEKLAEIAHAHDIPPVSYTHLVLCVFFLPEGRRIIVFHIVVSP